MQPVERMNRAEFVARLVADKEAFDDFVYTPIEDAVAELKRRRRNDALEPMLSPFLPHGAPAPLQDGERLVLARQIATPNYEMLRFMGFEQICGVEPLVLEYHDDRFTSRNAIKCRLGKLKFFDGLDKNCELKRSYETIIDFTRAERLPLKEVGTLWGQGLVNLHHQLLGMALPAARERTFDASQWALASGGAAGKFYASLMSLFVRHAILFENFLLNKDEMDFTKNVFLPAFLDVMDATSHKPLIVALTPTSLETDELWSCYPPGAKLRLHEIQFERLARLAG